MIKVLFTGKLCRWYRWQWWLKSLVSIRTQNDEATKSKNNKIINKIINKNAFLFLIPIMSMIETFFFKFKVRRNDFQPCANIYYRKHNYFISSFKIITAKLCVLIFSSASAVSYCNLGHKVDLRAGIIFFLSKEIACAFEKPTPEYFIATVIKLDL